MKIRNIIAPTFGYNKEFHQEVEKYLSTRKQGKEIAQALLEADKFSLQIEEKIKEMEHSSKKQSTAFEELTYWYSDLKSMLAYHMDLNFPKLKYVAHINNQYNDEALYASNNNAISWRLRICNQIKSLILNIATEDSKTTQKTQEVQAQKPEIEKVQTEQKNIPDEQQTLDDVRKQAIDDYETKKQGEILEIFVPTVTSPKGFADVAGMEEIKAKFKTDLIDYIQNPLLAELDEHEYGIKPPRGFLFYGPPGCGKTFITQALAIESGLPMFKMDVSRIGSKYINQTSVNMQAVFDFLTKYVEKTQKPCILFMDEVDSIAINRDSDSISSNENIKTTTTLLKLIEQARDKGIIVIAATNKYDNLDDAFKSRFDSQVYFGLPDLNLIKTILKSSLSSRAKGIELSLDDEKIEMLAKKLEGYSNRSIVFIVDEASKLARNNSRNQISFQDVETAIQNSNFEKPDQQKYIQKSKLPKKSLGFK